MATLKKFYRGIGMGANVVTHAKCAIGRQSGGWWDANFAVEVSQTSKVKVHHHARLRTAHAAAGMRATALISKSNPASQVTTIAVQFGSRDSPISAFRAIY